MVRGFSGGTSGKEYACQCQRHRDVGSFLKLRRSPGVGFFTPVFLRGESHGQRSLEGYSPRGHTESDMTEMTKQQQQ